MKKNSSGGEERHTNDNIRQMVADYPKEFEVAKEIRTFIGDSFKVSIPESETYYLAVLLVSLRTAHSSGKISCSCSSPWEQHGKQYGSSGSTTFRSGSSSSSRHAFGHAAYRCIEKDRKKVFKQLMMVAA